MTVSRVVFLSAFILGLVLVVFSMLNGIERTHGSRARIPSPFFNLPAVAAFAVGFGAVGYPLASRTGLSVGKVIALAAVSGGLAVTGMITLIARWALRGAATSPSLTEDEIQGQLAVVTREIGVAGEGEISYEHLGRRVAVTARASNTVPLRAGTEVVIDRIEAGVAFVEEWTIVEQRL